MRAFLITIAFVGSRKIGIPKTSFIYTCCMTRVTPTDCPKSYCNTCVIDVFNGVFVMSLGFNFLMV